VVQSKLFSVNKTLQVQGKIINLNSPKVMGILNVTPDSFYDGGRYNQNGTFLKHAEKMIREGADFIDVGGYSSRPGAVDIPVEEELSRTTPVIRALKKEFPFVLLSIDTFRSQVADAAVNEGAGIVNDISAGDLDPAMYETMAKLQVPYIAMHMRGTPQTMNQLTHYENLLKNLIDFFHQKIQKLTAAGVKDVIVDPGFGFAKTPAQNFELLKHLNQLHVLERPMLVGLSRKSMIWRTLEISPEDSLNGTSVLNTMALIKGASILRVHDVKQAREVIALVDRL
jgi:dihydropteroate synthase